MSLGVFRGLGLRWHKAEGGLGLDCRVSGIGFGFKVWCLGFGVQVLLFRV